MDTPSICSCDILLLFQKPTSLRIDQLDKSHCEENDGGDASLPLIVHCGIRPAQLSYAGDPE